MRPWRFAVVSLVALICALPARAQDPNADFWPRTHVFRRLVNALKLTPLRSEEDLANDPSRTMLVILGRPRTPQGEHVLDRIPGGLQQFVEKGGAVLIATDDSLVHQQLRALCGHSVNGGRVSARTQPHVWNLRLAHVVEPESLYRNVSQCVIPAPIDGARPPLFFDSPQRRGARKLRVATNSPSFLERGIRMPEDATLLARFPAGCLYFPGGYLAVGFPGYPFAVAAEPAKGRLVLLADQSVFANDMILEGLRHRDNDNFHFAYNVVEWLRGQDGQRNRVLYIEDGRIETNLEPPLESQLIPLSEWLREATALANEQLQAIQEERKINEVNGALMDAFNRGPGFYRLLVILATAALALYALRRMMRAAHRPDTSTPLFEAIVGGHRPGGSTLLLRQRQALAEDDLREFAAEAARDWFEALPGYPEHPEKPPKVKARSYSLRREVLRLWRLAQGEDDRPRMKQTEFQTFLQRLDELSQMVQWGELRILW